MIPYDLLEEWLMYMPDMYPIAQPAIPTMLIECVNAIFYKPDTHRNAVFETLCLLNWGGKIDAQASLPKGFAELRPLTDFIQKNYTGKANIKPLVGIEPDARKLGNLRCAMINNAYAHLGLIYGIEFLECIRQWYKSRNDYVRLGELEKHTQICRDWITNYDLQVYGYPFSK